MPYICAILYNFGMLKKFALGILLCILALFLFHNRIILYTIDGSLHSLSRQYLRGELSTFATDFKTDELIYHQPVIQGASSRPFQADLVKVGYEVSWLERKLTLMITLDHPRLELEEDLYDFYQTAKRGGLPFFQIDVKLKVENGEIALKENGLKAHLNLSLATGPAHHLISELYSDEIGRLFIHQEPHVSLMSAEAFQLPFLSGVFSRAFPSLFPGSVEGLVEGSLKAEKGKPLTGDLKIGNLKAHGFVQDLSWDSDLVSCRLSCPNLQENDPMSNLTGELKMEGGSFIQYGPLKLIDLKLQVALDKQELAVKVNGIEETLGEKRHFEFLGGLNCQDLKKIALTALLEVDHPFWGTSLVKLNAFDLGKSVGVAELELKNFGLHEFTLLENAVKGTYPDFNPIDFHSGVVDANVKASFSNYQLSEIYIENMLMRATEIDLKTWDMTLGAEKVSGFLKINLAAENPAKTLNSELLIVDGEVKFNGFEKDLWRFSNIQTTLSIQDGVIQKSLASVELAGLKGKAEIDWISKAERVKLDFKGTGLQVKPFMPLAMQPLIDRSFLNDEIAIQASVTEEINSFRCKGSLLMHQAQTALKGEFGFDIKNSEIEETWLFNPLYTEFWQGIASVCLPSQAPPQAFGSMLAIADCMQEELGVQGLIITHGWASLKDVPLEKYVSPFMFRKKEMELSGRADVNVLFDLKGAQFNYTGRHIVLENEHVKIEMPQVKGENSSTYPANHFVDFNTYHHIGKLPLVNGSYIDKRRGLLFSDIQGEAHFVDQKIYISGLETYTHGMLMGGSILVDYSDPREGYFDVLIKSDLIQGRFTQLKSFLSPIDPSLLFLKLPIDGNLNFRGKGAEIVFHILPVDYTWDLALSASLSDGTFLFQDYKATLQELSFNFDWNSILDQFSVTDVGGTLFLGDPHQEDELWIESNGMVFKSLSKRESQFDFAIKDKKRELFKVEGTTSLKTGDLIDVQLELKNTHLGEIRPKDLHLVLTPKAEIDSFKLLLPFRLSDLLREIYPLSKAGLVFLPPTLLKSVNEFSHFGGELKASLSYDRQEDRLYYEVEGPQIEISQQEYKNIHIEGFKQKDKWSVKNFQVDEISVSLDIVKKDLNWLLEYLELKIGTSAVVGLEGEARSLDLQGKDPFFRGHIHLLEIDFEQLKDFKLLRPFVEKYHPKGILKGMGSLNWHFDEGVYGLEASLTTTLGTFEMGGVTFKGLEPFSLEFILHDQLILKNVRLALTDPKTSQERVKFSIGKMAIDFESGDLSILESTFQMPHENLLWVSQFAAHHLQKRPEWLDTVERLKNQGDVKGAFDLKWSNQDIDLVLMLVEDTYLFKDSPYQLKDFRLELTEDELTLSSQVLLEDHWIWMSMNALNSNLERGQIVLMDTLFEVARPLILFWRVDPDRGFIVDKMEGELLGVHFDLKEDPQRLSDSSFLRFIGFISFDFLKAKYLLDPSTRAKIETLGLGPGYHFTGQISLAKDLEQSKRKFSLFGDLKGHYFQLKNMYLEHLNSQIFLTDEKGWVRDLTIQDPAGTLSIPLIHLDNLNHAQWRLQIPRLEVTELRPSLLWDVGTPQPIETKPLLVQTLSIDNLEGPFDPLVDLKGTGSLKFVNPVKNNLRNTIFVIPAEILSRIGIDLIALTPVTGTLHFEIKDEKIFLTKFKDVHSDGKLSKFNLANAGRPSYMDFDGNLHVQIKMKQYTLLFKLAELFTFNIGGTLSKPTYSLQKQHSKEEIKVEP